MRRAAVLLALASAVPVVRAGDVAPPAGPPRDALGVRAGLFEFTDDTYREAELGVQYHWAHRWGAFHPMAGGMVTSAGAFHLYGGVAFEIPAGRRLLFRGGFAPGYYDRGARGKDLGLALEFRSSLEIGWRLGDGWRLGLEIYHLSNADLGEINPGDGSLLLVLTFPVGRGR